MSSLAKLLAGRKKDSSVWKFFIYDTSTNKSKCKAMDSKRNECGIELCGKNPTNLSSHLKRFHKSEFIELEFMEKERNIKSSLKQRKAEADLGKKQTIGQCFQRNSAGWHVDSLEHKDRVNSIVDMLIETCNPVTHVDKPSFRYMWKVGDSKFNLPGNQVLDFFLFLQ